MKLTIPPDCFRRSVRDVRHSRQIRRGITGPVRDGINPAHHFQSGPNRGGIEGIPRRRVVPSCQIVDPVESAQYSARCGSRSVRGQGGVDGRRLELRQDDVTRAVKKVVRLQRNVFLSLWGQ